jgi:ketosteroid isomerase-like protein
MFRWLFLLTSLAAVAACASTPLSIQDNQKVTEGIRSVLEAQQAAWNRGSVEDFMDGYERSETTTFISGDEITRGWQTVLDRYRKRYTSPEQMGTLSFSDLEIHGLSDSYAMVDGRWKLTRGNDAPHGRFTLLFRKTPSGWRIFHDTTTSATP